MNEIKAIILDVDGVIVGEKIGFNSPHPNKKVVDVMKKIRKNGIPIVLCTAKPHFAIRKEIRNSALNNVHITDGGAVIIDPMEDIIVEQNNIPSDIAEQILESFIKENVYIEFYTTEDYFIQKSQASAITKKHAYVIQGNPVQVDSLVEQSRKRKVTKIMPIAIDEKDKSRVYKVFEPFSNKLVISWGVHPVILPLQFGVVTTPGVSKKQAAIDVSKSLKVPFTNILGVGDSDSDWQFIEMCGYAAAMGNAKQSLKDKVVAKGANNSFVAPGVDDNGIMEVFKHFGLI